MDSPVLPKNELQSKIHSLISQTQLSSDLESALRTYSFIHTENERSTSGIGLERDAASGSTLSGTNLHVDGFSAPYSANTTNIANAAPIFGSKMNHSLHQTTGPMQGQSNFPTRSLRSNSLSAKQDHDSDVYINDNMSHHILNVIETAQIATFEQILHAYQPIKQKNVDLKRDIEHLAERLSDLDHQFDEYDKDTKDYITALSDLQQRHEKTKLEMENVTRFLEEYQLTSEEMHILSQGEISTRNDASFFKLVLKVHDIKSRATTVLTTQDQTPRAWIEVIEEMSMYQDSALSRLAEWIQDCCKKLQNQEDIEVMQAEEDLSFVIQTFTSRTTLLLHCTSEIENARGQALLQHFRTSLPQKSGTTLHATDTVNYVGDIFAWAHQTVASERELIYSLLGVELNDNKPLDNGKTMKELATKTLSEILIGLSKQIEQRIERLVFTTESRLDVQNYFRIAHLCELYTSKISKLLETISPISQTLLRLRDIATVYFLDVLDKDVDLFKEEATQIPLNLAPPLILLESLQKIHEIMSMFVHSIVPEEKREEEFSIILKKGIHPLIEHLQLISTTSVQRSHQCIFLINCFLLMQKELLPFQFTLSTVNILEQELDQLTEEIIHLQTQDLLNKFGFDSIIAKMREIAPNSMFSLAPSDQIMDNANPAKQISEFSTETPHTSETVEGETPQLCALISEDKMQSNLQSFYQLLFSMGPEGILENTILKRVANIKFRNYIFSRILKNLSICYERIYETIFNTSSGYKCPHEIAFHSPEQVRQLLQVL